MNHAGNGQLDDGVRRFKRYPAYKESGVGWLGDIPSHWNKEPLKVVTRFVNGAAFKPQDWGDEGVPIIRIENLNGNEAFNYTKVNADPRYHVRQGDLLFAWSGNRGTSFGPFLWQAVGLHYLNQHIFRLEEYKLDKQWFYWLLKAVTAYVETQAHGIIGLVHITKQELGTIHVPNVSPDEQRQIVNFLDRETAKIDALVAKKERLIELLQEKRTALISHAVTKGLDANVPMKDSGIEWLGEIPKHWEVMSLRRVVKTFVDYRGKTPEKVAEGTRLVTARNIKNGEIDFSESEEFIRPDDYDAWMVRGFPSVGDVLITTEAPLGESAQIVDPSVALAQRIILLKVHSNVMTNAFLKHYIHSKAGQGELWSRATGSTAVGIKASHLKGIGVIVPPMEEQDSIVRLIAQETAKFDKLIYRVQEAIDKLRELRTALISAAVTGKIDVREEVA